MTPQQRIRAARTSVQLATILAGGPTLQDVARAGDALHAAAAELRSLETEYRSQGIADPSGEFRAELACLRQDFSTTGRVIDTGAALYRGLALRITGESVSYAPQGIPAAEDAAPAAMELVG